MNITVIDSIMGSGKTTWMLNHIKQQYRNDLNTSLFTGIPSQKRYLYITPSLAEVDRVTLECAELDFRNPEPVEGRKYFHLDKLIEEGHNICTTHSLFRMLSRETYKKLTEAGYTLVIDEVLNCVELFSALSKRDQQHLKNTGMIQVEPESGKLKWNEVDYGDYQGRFNDIRELCRNGNLILCRGSLLIWEFPIDFFKCFDQVFILTYLFHGSAMVSYLAAGKIGYTMMAIQDGQLVEWDKVDESALKASLRNLVTIYEGRCNSIGESSKKEQPFSSSWFDRCTTGVLEGIRASTTYFFKKVAKTPSRQNAWTSFKKMKPTLSGEGYGRGFLPNNLRATNDYIEKTSLAYLCNIFYHPYIKAFFDDRRIPVYEDLYALSEMLQWLWRGQIRRGDPIQVFIPSGRMRRLLKMWLESENTAQLFTKAGYSLEDQG